MNWNAFQGSSISSCSLLTRSVCYRVADAVDPAFVEAFKAQLHQWIALAFAIPV